MPAGAGVGSLFGAWSTINLLVTEHRTAKADLPIHCEEHQAIGQWKIYGKRSSCAGIEFPNTVASTLEEENKKSLENDKFQHIADVVLHPKGKLELLSNGGATDRRREDHVDENAAAHKWTMAYDEGFELRLPLDQHISSTTHGTPSTSKPVTSSLFAFFEFQPLNKDKHLSASSYYGENDDGTVTDFRSNCGKTMFGWGDHPKAKCWYAERVDGSTTSAAVTRGAADASFMKQQVVRWSKVARQVDGKPVSRKLVVSPMIISGGPVGFFPVPQGALGHQQPLVPSEEWNRNPLENAAQVETALSSPAVATNKNVRAPKAFDWHATASETVFGQSEVLNQGSCGSCYAIASVAAIEARFRIGLRRRYGVDVPLQLSPESVVSCSETNQGCNGGLPFLVGRHAKTYGIREASCLPYDSSDQRDLGYATYDKCMRDKESDTCPATKTSFFQDPTPKNGPFTIKHQSFLMQQRKLKRDQDFVGPPTEEELFQGPKKRSSYHMDWSVFMEPAKPSDLLPLKLRTPYAEVPASSAKSSTSFLQLLSEKKQKAKEGEGHKSLLSSVGGAFEAAYQRFQDLENDLFPVYHMHGNSLTTPNVETTHPELHKLLKQLTYFVKDYGYVGNYYGGCNEELMKQEIYQHGPVAIAAEVPDELSTYSGGVFSPPAQPKSHLHYLAKNGKPTEDAKSGTLEWELTTHAMVAVGFGVTADGEQTPYWTVRNSWGQQWGDNGYFLYKRGSNAGGIEHQAVWFKPDFDRFERDLQKLQHVAPGGKFSAGQLLASVSSKPSASASFLDQNENTKTANYHPGGRQKRNKFKVSH
ncbi:unnamed protein product [Amoebophrya sp. A120]|nr:unnamed protein product [Amoebophrya sp. A120]|eukprot:GSA120T00016707001.1